MSSIRYVKIGARGFYECPYLLFESIVVMIL